MEGRAVAGCCERGVVTTGRTPEIPEHLGWTFGFTDPARFGRPQSHDGIPWKTAGMALRFARNGLGARAWIRTAPGASRRRTPHQARRLTGYTACRLISIR